ncbi:MAG: 2-iminoacetate synthase ThiH [Geothermobacteraceae bacterium]
MSFRTILDNYTPKQVADAINACSARDVELALGRERLTEADFMALLSPAAESFLEQMARRSLAVTRRRFGNTILLYAPLYLSNECGNGCRYCGFSADNRMPRRTLDTEEIEAEARVLAGQGFQHVLLLTGEAPARAGVDYLARAVRTVRPHFSSIGIEVFPMATGDYARLVDAGVDSLTIYQETYDRELYERMHPFGKKRDYDWRLEAPERGGAAGMRKIGIGALLGLGDFRADAFFTGLHGRYLARTCWRSQLTVSFPRLRPADGGFQPLQPVSDRSFVQLICAMRLWLHDAGLVLSTRERAELRDNLLPLGITQMSAGSCTAPGGYSKGEHVGEQFAIDDDRSPAEFAAMLRRRGFDPVWKDWDAGFADGPPNPAA